MQTLTIPDVINSRLVRYLDVPVERMAFLVASPDEAGEVWTVLDDLYLTDCIDYVYQDVHGMELADEVRPRVLTWATRSNVALIEVHSHGHLSFQTTFSATDLDGLEQVVPQLLWRLRGRPYAALVLGGTDLDALCWSKRVEDVTVPVNVILGSRELTPTGLALHGLSRKAER